MKAFFPFAAILFLLAGCNNRPDGQPIVFVAETGPFVHEISVRGTVFSPGGTEVRCEVDATSPEGTNILEIVPEGTSVEPGDPLVHLDRSEFEEARRQQQILCNRVEAEVAAASNERDKAMLAKQEYVEGLYPEEKKAIEDELFSAERRLDRASRALKSAEEGERADEAPEGGAESLEFDSQMARREFQGAKRRLEVLEQYTKPLRLKQLGGAVESAEAILRAKESEHSLQEERLAEIEEQIEACTITAPVEGVVFYENMPAETEEDDVLIGEGTAVRRRQVILRIAQLDELGVRVEIPESEIAQVEAGMPAEILVDAMPETPFEGHVSRVHPYPTRETRGTEGRKRYQAVVAIDNPSGTLRPGLTAEVVVTTAQMENALQVPETSVYEQGGAECCLVRVGDLWQAIPVVTGPSDGKRTVIQKGLDPGQEVAIYPLRYRSDAGKAG